MADVPQDKSAVKDVFAQIAAAIEANIEEQAALYERTFTDLDTPRTRAARPKPSGQRPVMTDAERAQRREEQRSVIAMVAEGQITAEEGRKLLAALDESYGLTPPLPPAPPLPQRALNAIASTIANVTSTQAENKPRALRLRVINSTTGQTKATMSLPLPVIDLGLDLTARFGPRLPAIITVQGQRVDLTEVIEAVRRGERGRLLSLTTDKGDIIEIAVD